MAHEANVKEWLAENPKMMGAVWMLMLILAETGSVVADNGATAGP